MIRHSRTRAGLANLRDNYGFIKHKDLSSVSPDDAAKHKKFENKFDLPFTLIADPKLSIQKYGVWGPNNYSVINTMDCNCTTFLIDEIGVIRKIFLKPQQKHTEEILKAWDKLNS